MDAIDWDRAVDEAARKVFGLAVPMGLSYVALVLLFLAAGSYMTRLPAISAGFVAGFLTILAARLLLCRSEEGWRAHHPRRWVRVHGILSLSTGTLWSIFCCVALIVDGFTVITMLLLVCTAAISAVASAQLAPFLRVAQGFHGVTLVPVALLSAVTLGSEGLLLGGIVLTSLGFHLRMTKVHHRAHWQAAVHTALLRTRERTHALLAAALEHAGEAVEITDAQGRVEYVNPAFERMTGYSRHEARDRNIASLHPPAPGEAGAPADLIGSLAKGQTWTGSLIEETKQGPQQQEVTVSPVRDQEGNVTHHVWVRRDVTKTRALEARMALADRLAAVGTLAAGMAHEVNNPLAFLLLNLDEVSRGLTRMPDSANVRRLADHIAECREAAERIGAIVRELRHFSRTEVPQDASVSVHAMVDTAARLTANEVRHRAALEVDVPEDLPPVQGHQGRLLQALVNLLVNAVQAIDRAEPGDHRIAVRAWATEDARVHLQVRDTGPGFAPEHLAKVFDPFFTTKAPGEGTGLGLSVCHTMVEAMGGQIHVDNHPEGGALVTLTLHAARAPADTTPRRSHRVRSDAPENPLRVLVVDDEVRVGRALGRALRGHQVTIVTGGQEAVRKCGTETYDVILCDVMMPNFTGMDVYRALRSLGRGDEARIVFMTGGTFSEPVRAFVEQVDNPVLQKPFETHALREVLHQVAQKHGTATG